MPIRLNLALEALDEVLTIMRDRFWNVMSFKQLLAAFDMLGPDDRRRFISNLNLLIVQKAVANELDASTHIKLDDTLFYMSLPPAERDEVYARYQRSQQRQKSYDEQQMLALLAAGWQPEWEQTATAHSVMSWYWRRPPRRKSSKGRLFVSTEQAYRALMKSKAADLQ